ncbi:hypothetical protein [Streptomyces sp. NPDC093225]|uniref:hypothetical protein n=1 Tax=Streptomyces sp. NPDC093225 TaxID=3366034 RepID=UPI003826954F
MYLIHAALRAPSAADRLPSDCADAVRALARSDTPVEHVSAHPDARPDPVLGVYVLAGSLREAEDRTAALCRRALRELPALRGWAVGRVGAPLVAPYYERLLETVPAGPGPGPGPSPAGRNRPGPFPSSRKPFRPS